MSNAKQPHRGFGKVILFNEHFVVHGLPSIASAVSDYTDAVVEKTASGGVVFVDNRPETPGYKKDKLAQQVGSQNRILERLHIDPATNIRVTIGGPLQATSGVGSSTAIAVAIIRALAGHFGKKLTPQEINEMALYADMAYAGTPSGVDNTAATYGGIFIFTKGPPMKFDLLNVPAPMKIVMGNTKLTSKTDVVVGDVRKLKEAKPEWFAKILDESAALVEQARSAIESGDIARVGALMDRNHALLRQITVSCPELELLVKTAKDNGALGAKLTGTGRGGYMVALAPDAKTQKRIADSFQKLGFPAMETEIGRK